MRIVVAIGVLALLVGLGLAARFFLADSEQSMDLSGLTDVIDGSSVEEAPQPASSAEQPAMDAAQDAVTGTPSAVETMAEVPESTVESDGGTGSVTMTVPDNETQEALLEDPGPIRFSLPIDCIIGIDCYISAYLNAGSESNPQDYSCGSLSYGTHRGTDFRLIDHVQMEAGVNVLAAAPGTVIETRDGMPDANYKLFGRSIVDDRGLGNAVVIDHGNGLQTGYGHLKRGSVSVAPGDLVRRGQVIGQVGLSGLTEYPHVQFEVNRDGNFVDPFTGGARFGGCGIETKVLWRDDAAALLRYPRTLVMRTGFAGTVLNWAAVEYDLFDQPPISTIADSLVFHVYLAGVQAGDGFVAEIVDPNGERFVKSGRVFERNHQVQLLAFGRQRLSEALLSGVYTATFRYYRNDVDGQEIELISFTESVSVQ